MYGDNKRILKANFWSTIDALGKSEVIKGLSTLHTKALEHIFLLPTFKNKPDFRFLSG
jgi:hypothetical protein